MKAGAILLAIGIAMLSATGAPHAAPITFIDESAFIAAAGAGTVVNFDTDGSGNPIANGAALDSQYSSLGVDINPFNGGNPVATTIFPRSSPNNLQTVPGTGGGGGFEVVFSPGFNSVGLQIGDLGGPTFGNTILQIFDGSGGSLGSFNLFNEVGDGSLAYLFFGILSDTPISKLQISIGAADYVTFDDFRLATSAVPEPSTLVILALGLIVLIPAVARRRNTGGT